jgi:hypothetical protein
MGVAGKSRNAPEKRANEQYGEATADVISPAVNGTNRVELFNRTGGLEDISVDSRLEGKLASAWIPGPGDPTARGFTLNRSSDSTSIYPQVRSCSEA